MALRGSLSAGLSGETSALFVFNLRISRISKGGSHAELPSLSDFRSSQQNSLFKSSMSPVLRIFSYPHPLSTLWLLRCQQSGTLVLQFCLLLWLFHPTALQDAVHQSCEQDFCLEFLRVKSKAIDYSLEGEWRGQLIITQIASFPASYCVHDLMNNARDRNRCALNMKRPKYVTGVFTSSVCF